MSLPPSTDERPVTKDKKSFWGEPQAIATIVAAVIAAIATIVVALISGDVINISPGPAIQPPSVITAPQRSSGQPPAATTTTPAPDPTTTVKVRRSTGDNPLTLSNGYLADLDSMNPGWDQKYAEYNGRNDIYFIGGGLSGYGVVDVAIVGGQASYDTCLNASGFTQAVNTDKSRPGTSLCVRTSEKRYAYITIKKLVPRDNPEQIQLDVTVWDQPFNE